MSWARTPILISSMSLICAAARVGARTREAATPSAASAAIRRAGITSGCLLTRSCWPLEFAGRLACRAAACQLDLALSEDRAAIGFQPNGLSAFNRADHP